MRAMKRVMTVVMMAAALGAGASFVGCGPQKPKPRVAQVTQGTLPAGESFSGVWYNSFRGELHLIQTGNKVEGGWNSKENGRWGKLQGEVSGDVVRYTFEEYKTGMIGPGAKSKGKGYFKFAPGEPPNEPSLKGEYGFLENEAGNEWVAGRMKDAKPSLDDVKIKADTGVDTGWVKPAAGK